VADECVAQSGEVRPFGCHDRRDVDLPFTIERRRHVVLMSVTGELSAADLPETPEVFAAIDREVPG
jgi:hypothetical protein